MTDVAPSAFYRLTVEEYHALGEAGVPELWIVDLGGRAIEGHRRSGPDGYGTTEHLGEDGALTVGTPSDLPPIPVRDVLPPAEA